MSIGDLLQDFSCEKSRNSPVEPNPRIPDVKASGATNFRHNSTSQLSHIEITLKSQRHRNEISFKSHLYHSGIISVSPWNHSSIKSVSPWNHSGIISISPWNRSGITTESQKKNTPITSCNQDVLPSYTIFIQDSSRQRQVSHMCLHISSHFIADEYQTERRSVPAARV